jgi:hypothetical protein
MDDSLRAPGVSGRHELCVIVASPAERDSDAQRSRPNREVNGGLELDRLSVQTRGHGVAGAHLEGARNPSAAGRPGGTTRPVENEDSEPAAVERRAEPAPAPTMALVGVVRHEDDGGVGVDDINVVHQAHAGQFRAGMVSKSVRVFASR